MSSNPEPEDTIRYSDAQSPIMETNPHGPKAICLLEVQRRVVRIGLQQSECAVRESLNIRRESAVRVPKVRGGVVDHKTVERPDS
jgi:hypothetical protein